MNLGLIELPRALRQFLSKRNSSTQAFSLQDPTPGSILGGNARGAGSVDLQMGRVAATQVASGSNSFVAGVNNTVSANASVAMGNGNLATGSQSSICGGRNATTNSISGLLAYGFQGTSPAGQNQMSFFGARPITTDATARRATTDDAAAATTNQLTLRNTSAFRFNARIVARDATTNDAKEWEVRGLIKRGADAANTSLVGTPVITSEFADTAAAAWTIAVSADTTNGSLAINVTGEAGKTIRWTVVVWSQEIN